MAREKDADDFQREYNRLDENPTVSELEATLQATRDLCEAVIARLTAVEESVLEKDKEIERLESDLTDANEARNARDDD